MSLKTYFSKAPSVRPYMNLGCLFDIQNGQYVTGQHGESILTGGHPFLTGIAGLGNTFKSVLAHTLNLIVLDRYGRSQLNVYDTEFTVKPSRFSDLAESLPYASEIDFTHSDRFMISDPSVMSANEWFDALRKLQVERRKQAKELKRQTPFIDPDTGALYEWYDPFLAELDSLSMFMSDSVEDIYAKNNIGESGANMVNMKDAVSKTQMVMQMMGMTASAGLYVTFTMHVGEQHQLDPYAPNVKQLRYLKGKLKIKNVPEKVSFLMNSLWMINYANPLINKSTKAPEFPRDRDDDLEGDTDLVVLGVQGIRIKGGKTGLPFELIVSQSEGLLIGLSEFWYCKSYDRFGIGGNDRNYYMELYPECSLSRTTVRGKINSDPKLKRALEITSELCQMRNLWTDHEGLWCDPKTLYEDLKAQGYDWDQLLSQTRNYWVFVEDDKTHPLKFLSTKDLLKMRKGQYKPYWM